MAAEIISTGAALVGGGSWFLGKILGPSADKLGEHLSVYLGERASSIMSLAEKRAKQQNVVVGHIPPGLFTRMLVDSSFSTDDETITSWWANLLLQASQSTDNHPAIFSDMMAMVGPQEAACLSDFMNRFEVVWTGGLQIAIEQVSHLSESIFDDAVKHWLGDLPVDQHSLLTVISNMTRGQVPWPLTTIQWKCGVKASDGSSGMQYVTNPWFRSNVSAISVLERIGILRRVKVTLPTWDSETWATGLTPTPVGAAFYLACVGGEIDRHREEYDGL